MTQPAGNTPVPGQCNEALPGGRLSQFIVLARDHTPVSLPQPHLPSNPVHGIWKFPALGHVPRRSTTSSSHVG